MMTIQYKDLKKNDEIRSKQLGQPIDGKLLESPKQGRGLKKTILIWTKGSQIGMFDEHGSVWATDVTEVLRDGDWLQVTGQTA
jgi:hypothetical protein